MFCSLTNIVTCVHVYETTVPIICAKGAHCTKVVQNKTRNNIIKLSLSTMDEL